MIAEKPRAAAKIAEALEARNKINIDGVSVWIGKIREKDVVIAPTAGHLYTLHTNERGFPVFNYSWGPRWIYEKNSKHLEKFYKALKKLFPSAEYYVNACDYDVEGSVIGYNIISNLGDVGRAYRVKFSTLTREEISRAFSSLQPLDWSNIESGLARHILDWIWGINVSRALMSIYEKLFEERLILSAGRVQSPTLLELLRRYLERETFVPEPMFTVSVRVRYGDREYSVTNVFEPFKKLDSATELVKSLEEAGRLIIGNVEERVLDLEPPPPFNLTQLQLESARLFRLSPAETLKIAEELYLESLISYPRTNSEKIPPSIDNTRILKNLTSLPELGVYASELLRRKLLSPREGLNEDPAHPAIHPTGYMPTKNLGKEKAALYELIVRRYLASFYPSARVEEVIYTLEEPRAKCLFKLVGRKIVSQEWLKVYRYRKIDVIEVPTLRLGEELKISSVRLVKLYTHPPQLHTKASILKWMEASGIGTEATRAQIIETLFERRYVRGRRIAVTNLGLRVAHVLSTLFRDITEVELTREFERKLREIALGRVSRKEIIDEAISKLSNELEEVKKSLSSYRGSELKVRFGLSTGFQCSICGSDAVGREGGLTLCYPHLRAYQNLVKAYDVWKARNSIDFDDYVETLLKLYITGRFVKDVIKYLMNRVK